tara:strand:- start:801 stop:1133 length:333 start_codon:yes stop_codon:yes gene_type:complete
MGLDWIARPSVDSKTTLGVSFRGKGIAYDDNVCEELEYDGNECYGEGDDHMMTESQRQSIIKVLKELLSRSEDEIVLDEDDEDDTYEEWQTFTQDALEFLTTYKYIYCWF